MERGALLRSLSCSTTACKRLLFSPLSSSRLFSSNLRRPRQRPKQPRAMPSAGCPLFSLPLRLGRSFSLTSIRAVSTSPSPVSRETDRRNDVAEKFGFEIISEQTIDECISTAVLYRHKKTVDKAMTFLWRTTYQGFYNLVDVYLDAVFFPKCIEDVQIFQQEGVVFNEMKGIYSQPDNILGRVTQQALFPENIYGVDSGGDPRVIPKLHLKNSSFLDHLLLGTSASPLRRILLESGLEDAIVGGGIEDELLQPKFSIGLKGVSEDDIDKVEQLITQTFKNLIEEGFTPEAVEASMNTIDFSLRENNTGSLPRGFSLMLRSIDKWIYDLNPFEPLRYEKPLQSLKARIAEQGSKAVFYPLLEKFILNNPHCVTVEMQPDLDKASRDEEDEKAILKKVKASMTEEDLAELARDTQDL
ncbi:hypothetical protein ZIOFF_072824 [Zingiber officinale]|uniref:Peptidase M16 C-terminal domain-containing protein n=1 Tax=Zingiber officinale TaxID=94328 RepID=A0A8J5BZE3_ZINOF|nr:hypothetical protein ZIOFF_072824 [Zingiber officinale]